MSDSPDREQLARCWDFVSQFAGRLAHDLSNIFTSVNGYSDLALLQLPAEHPVARHLRDGIRAGQRGIELSSRLHQLHVGSTASQSPSSLAPVVDLARSRLAQAAPHGVALDVRVELDLPNVAVAAEILLSIVLELLRNAVEACGKSGSVALKASVVEVSVEQALGLLGRASAGRHVEVQISDSGVGLPSSFHEDALSVPMSSKKPGHWGLGLAIVFRGLYACRGGLTFEMGPERGTVARAFLPVA